MFFGGLFDGLLKHRLDVRGERSRSDGAAVEQSIAITIFLDGNDDVTGNIRILG